MEGAIAAVIAAAIEAARAAGFLGAIVGGVLAYVFYRNWQLERADRIAIQDRVYGTDTKPGLHERTVTALENSTMTGQKLTEVVSPLIAAAVQRIHKGGDE